MHLGLTEALAIFFGGDEGLDHLSLLEVAVELIQLDEPEGVTGKSPSGAESGSRRRYPQYSMSTKARLDSACMNEAFSAIFRSTSAA